MFKQKIQLQILQINFDFQYFIDVFFLDYQFFGGEGNEQMKDHIFVTMYTVKFSEGRGEGKRIA